MTCDSTIRFGAGVGVRRTTAMQSLDEASTESQIELQVMTQVDTAIKTEINT
jgi:hypothetical protein